MGRNRIDIAIHLVWTTCNRAPQIDPGLGQWLWPAMANKALKLGCKRVVVGGVHDHVHVLVDLPATLDVAALVRHLKGASSHAANKKSGPGTLRWQAQYGAFSVRMSEFGAIARYVEEQPSRHLDGRLDEAFEPKPPPRQPGPAVE